MACPVPFPKKMPDGSVRFVPCGDCLACRIDTRNSWTWRLMSELHYSSGVFVTLTINDDFLVGPSLCKASVQRFNKRLRKALGNRKIKYFFVGEYGENTMRPHYHGIIIGLNSGKPLSYDRGDFDIIRDCWPFGFVSVKSANKSTIRYLLKYLDKMQGDKFFCKQHPNLVPPFRLMSKGLGRRYIEEHFDELRENDGKFFFDGAWRPLPRYYLEQVFTPYELSNRFPVMSASKMAKIKEFMNQYHCNYLTAMRELGKQSLVNLKAKQNLGGKCKGL